MKSPFPGMDPYLESRWSDVHMRLVAFISEALQPQLPADLRARGEQRVLVETPDEDVQWHRPDTAIIETRRPTSSVEGGRTGHAGHALLEPVIVELPDAPDIERFVKIVDVSRGNRVVTVIEILSPWNKHPGRRNDDYLRKLRNFARGGVNVVEIDLLRSSRDWLEVTHDHLPESRRTPYMVGVRRAASPQQWTVYAIPLRQPLPEVAVPLRSSDADVTLALQPLIERVYRAGGHDDIDYSAPCVPPLEGDDAAWARSLLEQPR